jgi:hypothetical protein
MDRRRPPDDRATSHALSIVLSASIGWIGWSREDGIAGGQKRRRAGAMPACSCGRPADRLGRGARYGPDARGPGPGCRGGGVPRVHPARSSPPAVGLSLESATAVNGRITDLALSRDRDL